MENSTNNVAQATQEAATIAQNAISSQPKTVKAKIVRLPTGSRLKSNGKSYYRYGIETVVAGVKVIDFADRNVYANDSNGVTLTKTDEETGEIVNVENTQPKLNEEVSVICNYVKNDKGEENLLFTITMAIENTPVADKLAAFRAAGII